ncbi:hypothetical protein ABEG63_01130 [Chryseobacterium sp. C39-AII1]|uniref:FEKKY domain-containing protein n=1 Tax=Chryseobacterium sp. C39-AII1 TaxID=3080332 RepID=UPI00320B3932
MKNSKLFLLPILLFSGMSYAQKNDVTITVKEKGKVAKTVEKQENLLHFIQFGMMSKNHQAFRSKYKIDIKYENCVISPLASKMAKENNLAIAKFLTEKYGDSWRKELEIIPYGL